jgi:hypothetical protein
MRLRCWNRASQDIEFDPETGSAWAIKLAGPRDDSAALVGFAHFERPFLGEPQIFAVFRQDDSLFFSAGARKWRLDRPGLRFVHSQPFPFFSRFRVIEGERVTFSILYSHLGRLLLALADPTYDKIDEDTDFFLSFVAEYGSSPEWRADVLRQWSRGSAV